MKVYVTPTYECQTSENYCWLLQDKCIAWYLAVLSIVEVRKDVKRALRSHSPTVPVFV